MRIALIPTLALLPLLVACESVDSESVLTSGVFAEYTAVSDGTDARAQAVLRVGGASSNTFLNLEGGDELSVSAGEESSDLSEQNLGDYFYYTADLSSIAPGTEYDFSFIRTVDDGAPSSTCSMPDAFELSGPEADAGVSRSADALTVSWTESGKADAMELRVKGDCIFDYVESISGDPGTFVVEAGKLQTPDEQVDQSCDATVELYRKRAGSLDAGFGEGGFIYAAQVRSVKIRLDP